MHVASWLSNGGGYYELPLCSVCSYSNYSHSLILIVAMGLEYLCLLELQQGDIDIVKIVKLYYDSYHNY